MSRYAGYILDLDGTVYRGEQVIAGAPEAIASLRAWRAIWHGPRRVPVST